MSDALKAIALGILVMTLIMLAILIAAIAFPLLVFALIVAVIWFIIQICKEELEDSDTDDPGAGL